MAMTVKSSGTQTATLTTEHSLLATTDSGVYVLTVDAALLAADETLTLRIKKPVLSGGTIRLAFEAVYFGPQGDPIKVSVPITAPFGATFTLLQVNGTGRAFPWSVEKLD